MAYEALGEVTVVTLGGINKTTGKKNPTELEGYLLGIEDRANKFNPGKPQKFYLFQTKDGEVGVYGKAGIDSVLRGARLGAMTKLVSTGETLDTGKGFPMKVFKAFQDKTNFIDIGPTNAPAEAAAQDSYTGIDEEVAQDDSDDSLFDETPPARPVAARTPLATPDAARQAKVQALLAKSRPRTP